MHLYNCTHIVSPCVQLYKTESHEWTQQENLLLLTSGNPLLRRP